MQYLSTKEFAQKHGVTPGRIRQLIGEGRVYPCRKIGNGWVMMGNSVILPPNDRHGFQGSTREPLKVTHG